MHFLNDIWYQTHSNLKPKIQFWKLRNFTEIYRLNESFPINTVLRKIKNTYFIPSKVCFAVKNVPLVIEWTISCEKDQTCCFTISPVVWCALCRSCSRKLVKDFGGCRSAANRSYGFDGQGSGGAACIIFGISVRSSSATNWNIFSLLERTKSMHEILLMFAITTCGVFLLYERNKSSGNIWSLSFSRYFAFLSF